MSITSGSKREGGVPGALLCHWEHRTSRFHFVPILWHFTASSLYVFRCLRKLKKVQKYTTFNFCSTVKMLLPDWIILQVIRVETNGKGKLQTIETIASIWRENMLGYLCADIICFEKRTENCELWGTDNVQGQISKHIFAPNRGYCVSFFTTRAVLKIGEYHSDIFQF